MEALIGSVATMSTSFIFPSLFFMLLFRADLIRSGLVLLAACFLAVAMTWMDLAPRPHAHAGDTAAAAAAAPGGG